MSHDDDSMESRRHYHASSPGAVSSTNQPALVWMRERHLGHRRKLKRPHFAPLAGPGWAVTLANAVALAWVTVARMARSVLQRP